jgi:hypothetical protein
MGSDWAPIRELLVPIFRVILLQLIRIAYFKLGNGQ